MMEEKKDRQRELQIEEAKLFRELSLLDEVPEFVKDEQAFREWQKLWNSPILTEKKNVLLSTSEVVSLGMRKATLFSKIRNLPEKEKKRIQGMKVVYDKMLTRANAMRTKAIPTSTKAIQSIKKRVNYDKMTAEQAYPVLKGRIPELLELFGSMHSTVDIHEICVMKWKLPVSLHTLRGFKNNFAKVIAKKQEEYKTTSITDLRLGNKISRLEELVLLFNEFKKRFFQEGGGRGDGVEAAKILEQIKREVEGDMNVNVKGEFDLRHSVEIHLHQEMLKGLPLRQMILAKVAAKLGVPPLEVVSQLTKSYYSKFSGALGNIEDADYEEIKHPTEEHYDFNHITRNSMEIEEARQLERVRHKTNVVKVNQEQEFVEKKEDLLAKVKEMQQAIQRKKSDVAEAKIETESKPKAKAKAKIKKDSDEG